MGRSRRISMAAPRFGRVGVRWRLVVPAGVSVAILTYALSVLLINLYATALLLLGFSEGGRWDQFTDFLVLWGMPVLYLALTLGASLWVGRRVGAAALLHGGLIGMTSFVVLQAIGLFFGPLILREVVVYFVLAMGGGLLGGQRGWAILSGEEALHNASRAVSAARDPHEITAAIGTYLAGAEVTEISLWESLDREGSEEEFTLLASWPARPGDSLPVGSRLNAGGLPVMANSGKEMALSLPVDGLPVPERATWEKRGVRSILLILLNPACGTLQGLLVVASRKRRGFSKLARRAYLTVSAPVALALENLRLVEQARRTGERAGMLNERQRVAREIHDTLAQGFTSIVMNLEAAEGALQSKDDGGSRTLRYLNQARLIARENLGEARRLVWAVRPELLEENSLPEALTQLAEQWSKTSHVEVAINVVGAPRQLPSGVELALVRLSQEAFANILKHARADRAVLTLSYMQALVTLDVVDDGIGFDVESEIAGTSGSGFGLHAMRERVEQFNGTLTIESAPGKGSTLVAALPVTTAGRGTGSRTATP